MVSQNTIYRYIYMVYQNTIWIHMVSQNNITNGFSEYLGHPWLVVCCPSTMLPAMACHPYGQDMEHHPAGGNHLMPVFLPADLADLASSGVSPLMENPSENPSETCRSSGIFGPISGKSPEETLQILVVDPPSFLHHRLCGHFGHVP